MEVIFSPPKISVIIGVLNMRDFLRTAIDSVIQQRYSPLELIIMDGGSTDGTLDIIQEYEKNITYWRSKPDKGHPDACNDAIDIATGDLIVFLNADDYFALNLLNKVAAKYAQNPHTDMITCGARIIEKNQKNILVEKNIFNDPQKLQLTFHNALFEFTAFNTRFYRKNLFTRFGKLPAFDAEGCANRANDREFLIHLTLNKIKTDIIPEPLYTYLSHDGASSFSRKNLARIHSEHLLIAEKLMNNLQLTSSEKNAVKRWYAREYFYLFLTYLREKKYKIAAKTFWEGFRKKPVFYINEMFFYGLKKAFKHN